MQPDGAFADSQWLIGGTAECQFRIGTSRNPVALIVRRGARVFVRDLNGGENIFVNETRIPRGEEQELTRFDLLQVGNTSVEIGTELFLGQTRLGVDTTSLLYSLPDRPSRLLCNQVFLRAKPGTFTGILGPAGSGKTVFLNLLNGYNAPSSGRIIVGNRYDLHRDEHLIRNYLGFVPQDDVMLPELTVRQSLDYRLQLRFPDMVQPVRARLIRETCTRLGFHESRLDGFMDTIIGSPDLEQRGLSGGERKRANIAHELVMKPVILLLDEPTSGLSSMDADQTVRLLRDLAKEEHLTVIATIHQPSQTAFERFDDLMVLTYGGRIAYYGPARKAVEFFEKATEDPLPLSGNPAEYVLSQTFEPRDSDRLVRYYQRHRAHLPAPATPLPFADESVARRSPPTESHWFQQVLTLLRRNLAVMCADKASLRLTFGQVPFIAILIWCSSQYFTRDGPDSERLARFLHFFSVANASAPAPHRGVPDEGVVEEALKRAKQDPTGISQLGAQRRGAIYFVLVAASSWLGTLGACREIVIEKPILRRECRSFLKLSSYLSAKLLAQALVTGLQCAVLVTMVVPWLLGLSLPNTLAVSGVLWLTGLASAALGLMISSLAPNTRYALTAVPMVMIPQLLFGGMLRPEADMPEHTVLPRLLGQLTLQRWAFEPILAFDSYAHGGVMIPKFGSTSEQAWDILNHINSSEGSLVSAFFVPKPRWLSLWLPLNLLMFMSVGFLLIGHVCLRWKLLHRTF